MSRSVKAFCVVEIIVECGDVWSEDATVKQVVEQARQSALGQLERLFRDAVTPDEDMNCKRGVLLNCTLRTVKSVDARIVESR